MRESGTNFTLEDVRRFFVNPRQGEIEEFAQLGADAIRAMTQIYASGGDPEKMSADTHKWLFPSSPSSETDEVRRVIGHVLAREAATRRFDHRFMGQIHPQGNEVGILSNLIAAYMKTNHGHNLSTMTKNCFNISSRTIDIRFEVFCRHVKKNNIWS